MTHVISVGAAARLEESRYLVAPAGKSPVIHFVLLPKTTASGLRIEVFLT